MFDDIRTSKEKAEKDSEGKTGEGEKDAEVFDEENEEGPRQDCELLKAMAWREAGMASKKKDTGPSKEHMAQGLALRDSARDGLPGRGATQGFPVVQPAGGRGKGGSSNSKSRYSAAAAANIRSRGEDCRFRRESETSDGEGPFVGNRTR
ncbi:unnamed protein product [Ectocarpus sp. CCAP 1310/34]|nr:unnamed protein product [Ectocarpus sp. CCAP 1310/34]